MVFCDEGVKLSAGHYREVPGGYVEFVDMKSFSLLVETFFAPSGRFPTGNSIYGESSEENK